MKISLKASFPEKNSSVYESVVACYGRHECKRYTKSKPINFGYKLWVEALTLGYYIQFYTDKNDNHDKKLGFDVSVVISLVSKLPGIPNSSYHTVMNKCSQVLIFFDR